MDIVISVNMWEFDPPSSFSMLTWVVFVWSVLSSCQLRSKIWYWQKHSGSSMKFSWPLWWTVTRPEFIVGYGKLWSISGWFVSISSSVIVSSFVSLNNYFSSSSSLLCSFMCINKVSIIMWIVHVINMIVWVFKADWVHFWSMSINCSLRRNCVGCIIIFIEVLRSW